MYEYLGDKRFEKAMRKCGSDLMHSMCHYLKVDSHISANARLVGSARRKLIMRNGNGPVDLDYNLEIVKCNDFSNGRFIKDSVIKALNKALHDRDLDNCEDSKSAVTTKEIYFPDIPNSNFSIDICIIKVEEDYYGRERYYRLIHQKTGYVNMDRYYWNEGPNSHNIRSKAEELHEAGKWNDVRTRYAELKNMYLRRNDHDHPSFVCYIQAVNDVYNGYKTSPFRYATINL